MAQGRPKVAIACQGGGTHTAFTAGVLRRLFAEPELDGEIVAMSGTSGGAICALLSWYGRLHPAHDPGSLLGDFWADLAANTPAHRAVNDSIQWGIAMSRHGFPLPEFSPYVAPGANWGQEILRTLLTRYVDFEAIADLCDGTEPALLMSAVDVMTGEAHLFRADELSVEVVLASAAEPHLFQAVALDGHQFWDGLFAKNPPLVDFMTLEGVPDPDEIWLVRINPQEREAVPKSVAGIADRRNELAGNLALNAEIDFLQQVNEWIEASYLPDRFTHTDVRQIAFQRPDLDWRTKLDRDPAFIEQLIDDGERAAAAFLERRQDEPTA